MIFHFTQNPYIAEQNDFILSNTVISLNMAAVTDQNFFDEKKSHTVVIGKNDELLKWHVSYNYANWKFYECDSSEEYEKTVLQGKADCFADEIGNVLGYQDNKKFHVISLSKHGNISFVTNQNSTALMSILNKTLKAVSSSVLAGVLSIYESTTRQVTVMDFIMANLIPVTVVFLVVFLLVLSVILNLLHKSRKAETKAESANTAKTTFLNNMSHDIRTLMNAIIGFTNIALEQNISERVRGCLEKISDSSDMLLTLINDVLEISRIESRNVRYNPTVVNISSITDKVLNLTSGLLTNRNLKFEVTRTKTDHPYVRAVPYGSVRCLSIFSAMR